MTKQEIIIAGEEMIVMIQKQLHGLNLYDPMAAMLSGQISGIKAMLVLLKD